MPPNIGFWTEERIAELKQLYDRGWSCSQIGAELGVTRNAIIGKLHRLGRRRGRQIAARTGDEHIARKPRQRKAKVLTFTPATRKISPRLVCDDVDDVTDGVGLLALRDHHCRCVISMRGDDGLPVYCGKRTISVAKNRRGVEIVERSAWCVKHYNLFHNSKEIRYG